MPSQIHSTFCYTLVVIHQVIIGRVYIVSSLHKQQQPI